MTAVIGGGITGLSAAHYMLKRFGKKEAITLYESSTRVGGWVKSERHPDKGFIFETGPRTIRPKGIAGANTLELIDELDLPIEEIRSNHVAARNRMIYANGKLCMLPNSIGGILTTKPPFSKPLISALFNDLRAGPKLLKNHDESIYDFVERRFGSEIAKYAISPMICGICAGDAKEISVRFLMDELFDKEQEWGGVAKGIILSKFKKSQKTDKSVELFSDGMPRLYEQARREKWSMYRVKDGLETLPRTLANRLRDNGVNMHMSTELRNIRFSNGFAKLTLKGREVEAKHIISALPSYKLAPCFKDQHPSLTALLNSIPYVSVAVVNLQYSSRVVLKDKAFGFLVPPVENLPILGVIYDSCCFDTPDNTILTVMMGGKWFVQKFGKNPSQWQLLQVAQTHLKQILDIKRDPILSRVNILEKCIPQYTVGHKQRVADIRRYIKQYKLPLSVCGAAYDGVGINDVILSARMQVEQMPLQKL